MVEVLLSPTIWCLVVWTTALGVYTYAVWMLSRICARNSELEQKLSDNPRK